MLTPQATYIALLVVQALHLLHHHLALIAVQVVGSVWIKRLSPNWSRGN